MTVFQSVRELGQIVESVRKRQGATQIQLAQMSNVGVRFVRDLEDGKPTAQMDKVLKVLSVLGIAVGYECPPGCEVS